MTEHLVVTEYDFIAVGTGLQESILASAIAKAGRSVLHLDSAAHYGSHWASLRLDHFLEWAQSLNQCSKAQSHAAVGGHSPPDSASLDHSRQCSEWVDVDSGRQQSAVGPGGLYRGAWIWTTPAANLGTARSYNIDLAPKVALCAGPLVQTLLRSGAHNYVEFKLLQGSYTWQEGHLLPVPASKGDVFRSRALNPSDKRVLMRFLKACGDAIEGRGHLKDAFGGQPFIELLQSEGLSKQLQEIVLYSIALCDSNQAAALKDAAAGRLCSCTAAEAGGSSEQQAEVNAEPPLEQEGVNGQRVVLMPAEDGWRALQLYMASAGKYAAGGSAFMALLYGVGELPQAFCRVAAVAGATYMLRQPVQALLVDPDLRTCIGVRTAAGQTLRCTALAADPAILTRMDCLAASSASSSSSAPAHGAGLASASGGGSIARGVCIIDGPLQEGESQLLVVIPPGAMGNDGAIRVLQVGAATCSTPEGRYLLYLSTPATAELSAAQSLSAAVHALVQLPPDACPLAANSSGTDAEGLEGAQEGASAELATTAQSRAPKLFRHQQVADSMPLPAVDRPGIPPLMDVRPKALMVAYYTQCSGALLPKGCELSNVVVCRAPDASLGFGSILEAVAASFKQLYPREEPPYFASGSGGNNEGEESDEEAMEVLHAALQAL